MVRLDEREWKPCRLSSLGKVESGRDIYALERVDGDIPYITSGSQNNGIGYFVDNKNDTYDKGYIAFNRNGAVGLAFYHPYWSVMGNDCRKLHLTEADENIYVGIFVATAISMQSKSFSYSRKLGTGRANKLQIMLPVTDVGEPDYQFMEDYIRELMEEKKKQYRRYVKQRIAALCAVPGDQQVDWKSMIDSHDWEPFQIGTLFDRIDRGKISSTQGLVHTEKGIPYVGATANNNGVLYCVECDDPKVIQDGNCVAFIRDGQGSVGLSMYRETPCVATVNVSLAYASWVNRYTGIFVSTSSNMIRSKYSFGYKRKDERLKRDFIMLPVTDAGEPDYNFMENYIKDLMLKKYFQQGVALLNKSNKF